MVKAQGSIWLVSALVVGLVRKATATTHYVAPTGASNALDSVGSGSREVPFKTAEFAASLLQPGDELVLLNGDYMNENYHDGDIWKSEFTMNLQNLAGTLEAPITIRGDTDNGNKHVLKGDGYTIFYCRYCHHVILKGLNVRGEVENIPLQEAWDNRFLFRFNDDPTNTDQQRMDPSWDADQIDAWFAAGNKLPSYGSNTFRPPIYNARGINVKESSNVLIEDCVVGMIPGAGIKVGESDYITVRGNTVHDCTRRSTLGTHAITLRRLKNDATGTMVVDHGYRFIIENNVVHDNYNEVYSWVPHKTFLKPHIDEGRGIVPAQVNWGSWITGRILIRNNIAYHNGLSGIHGIESDRLDIYHNTIFQNTMLGYGGMTGLSSQDCKDVNMENNIAISINDFEKGGLAFNVAEAARGTLEESNIHIANNLMVGRMKKTMPEEGFKFIFDPKTFDLDTLFVDATNLDFRLVAGSPAIDAGKDLLDVVPLDFAGGIRTSPPDMGAFEYSSTGGGSSGDGATPSPTPGSSISSTGGSGTSKSPTGTSTDYVSYQANGEKAWKVNWK